MKRCTKCKIEKPFSEYHRLHSRPDGYQCQCIKCRSTDAKKLQRKKTLARYYQRNKGKCKARRAAVEKYGPAKKFHCGIFGCNLRAVSLHHVSYAKPLDVIPLCLAHHIDSHRLVGDK